MGDLQIHWLSLVGGMRVLGLGCIINKYYYASLHRCPPVQNVLALGGN